jgi:perosamine synthetase
MNIPMTKPCFSEISRSNIVRDIDKILESGRLMMGQWTDKFEENFSNLTNTNHALTVNSCTTALQIALQFYNVKDFEVMVPSGSFITNISTIKWAGGKPVFIDMNPKTLSFDLDDMQKKLTKHTKGIMWVHLTGMISPEYREIVDFAKDNNLFLIEDCAHAHGAKVDGVMAGSIGDVGCFSFFPSKIMTTGTGGMLTTNNDNLAEYTKKIRLLGRCTNGSGEICLEGNDWFMDEIRACIGYYQLQEINSNLERRRMIAKKYNNLFFNHPKIRIFNQGDNNEPAYYQYVIIIDPSINRDSLIKKLKSKYGISSKRIYLATHQEPIFQDLEFDVATLQQTEETLDSSLCLPIFCTMTDTEVNNVAKSLLSEISM